MVKIEQMLRSKFDLRRVCDMILAFSSGDHYRKCIDSHIGQSLYCPNALVSMRVCDILYSQWGHVSATNPLRENLLQQTNNTETILQQTNNRDFTATDQ